MSKNTIVIGDATFLRTEDRESGCHDNRYHNERDLEIDKLGILQDCNLFSDNGDDFLDEEELPCWRLKDADLILCNDHMDQLMAKWRPRAPYVANEDEALDNALEELL